jgi:C4-dicarboxylate-specific signal transduction histidine kinase
MSVDRDPSRAAEQWLALSDALLAGLVHTLNNRVTALTVCSELAQLGDDQMIADGMLAGEVSRLQRAAALLSLLPARASSEPEALELRPVLDDALALHAHHPRMRTAECVVNASDAMQPVRAPRWALLRLLLLLVEAAKASAVAETRVATVHLASDELTVVVRVAAQGDGGPYGAEMAALCGGALAREGSDLVLTLPSLLLLRRREGSGRPAP